MRQWCFLVSRMGRQVPCAYNCGEYCKMAGFHHKQTGSRAQYLSLPGTSGNYASTPDTAANSITGDIDVRVNAALVDWTPSGNNTLMSKYTATGNQRSWRFDVATTTGRLRIITSVDGTGDTKNLSSTAGVPATDGQEIWCRATLDVDDGGGNAVAKFYTSINDGVTWTQLGTTVTSATTTSIFDSTAVVAIGALTNGTDQIATGKILRAQLFNGIDGSLVVDFNAQDGVTGRGPLTSKNTGEVWTINGANTFLN